MVGLCLLPVYGWQCWSLVTLMLSLVYLPDFSTSPSYYSFFLVTMLVCSYQLEIIIDLYIKRKYQFRTWLWSSCGHVYGAFSWLLITRRGPRSLWVMPLLASWSRVWIRKQAEQNKYEEQMSKQTSMIPASAPAIIFQWWMRIRIMKWTILISPSCFSSREHSNRKQTRIITSPERSPV